MSQSRRQKRGAAYRVKFGTVSRRRFAEYRTEFEKVNFAWWGKLAAGEKCARVASELRVTFDQRQGGGELL